MKLDEQYMERFYKKVVNGKKGNLFTRVDALEEMLKHLQVRDVTQYITNLIQENKEIIIPSLVGGVTDPTDETFSGIVISPNGQTIDGVLYSFAIVVDGVVVSGVGDDGTTIIVGGTGDMLAATYDPNTVAADIFDPNNTVLATGLADGEYSGDLEDGTAGATLVFGNLVYLQTADSRWELADATAKATCANRLGICVLASANDGDATKILTRGNVRANAVFPAMTIGAQMFVSTTAGEIQVAAPSGDGDIMRVVGWANTADELHFEVSKDYFELGTPGEEAAGGSDTQVQYNDGGDLAGDANFTWNGKSLKIAINGDPTIEGVKDGTYSGVEFLGGVSSVANGEGGYFKGAGGEGTGSGDGGFAEIQGGWGDATGNGGAAIVQGGFGGQTSGDGGDAEIEAGDAQTEGDGGDVKITAGTGAGAGVDGKIIMTGDTELTGSLKVSSPTGYAEMYMYDNVTACAIDVANVYHAIYNSFGNNDGTLAPLQDATHFTYKAGVGYAIAAFANYNAPTSTQTKVTITAGHALLAGEPITITGTTNYDGTYLVLAAGLSATEFVITKTYVADDATGSARRPATLKCLVAGSYRASFNFSGIAANNNDVFKWELNKDLVALDNVVARAIWTSGANNYRSVAASGLCSLTAGQYVWASVKNYSGTGDVTFNSGNVCLSIMK